MSKDKKQGSFGKPTDDLTIRMRVLRKISIPLTKLFLKTSITPNQITLFGIFLTFVRFFLFASGNAVCILIAALLMHFNELLDTIDGSIARCKNLCSLRGIFLDKVYHDLNYITLFMGVGVGLYLNTSNVYLLSFGFLATIFVMLTRNVSNHRTIVLYDKSKNAKKEIQTRIFKQKGLILRIKNLIYLPYLYLAMVVIIFSIFNLFFNSMNIYIILYGLYFPLYFIPVFYYASFFKEDKR